MCRDASPSTARAPDGLIDLTVLRPTSPFRRQKRRTWSASHSSKCQLIRKGLNNIGGFVGAGTNLTGSQIFADIFNGVGGTTDMGPFGFGVGINDAGIVAGSGNTNGDLSGTYFAYMYDGAVHNLGDFGGG